MKRSILLFNNLLFFAYILFFFFSQVLESRLFNVHVWPPQIAASSMFFFFLILYYSLGFWSSNYSFIFTCFSLSPRHLEWKSVEKILMLGQVLSLCCCFVSLSASAFPPPLLSPFPSFFFSFFNFFFLSFSCLEFHVCPNRTVLFTN